MRLRLAVIALALLAAAPLARADTVTQVQTSMGHVLADQKGMTLYTFDKDMPGVSACTDTCAQNWPPMMAGAMDKPMGEYGIIKRPDGVMQWTYRGKPLYHWIKDMKPGDMTGDGLKDVWHVARP